MCLILFMGPPESLQRSPWIESHKKKTQKNLKVFKKKYVTILKSMGKVIWGNPEDMGNKAGSHVWGAEDHCEEP